MKIKDYFNTVKLFCKMSFSLVFCIFILLFIIIEIIMFLNFVNTDYNKNDFFILLIFEIYFIPFCFIKFTTNEHFKFIRSMKYSKAYMTSVPVLVINICSGLNILLHIIIFISNGYINASADLLIITAMYSSMCNFLSLCSNRSGFLWILFYLIIFYFMISSDPLEFLLGNDFNISLTSGLLISILIYTASYIAELAFMKYTYKKGIKIRATANNTALFSNISLHT